MHPKTISSALLLALALTTTAHADALQKELQAAPAGSDAQKRIGQKICFQRRGPMAVALWTSDGKLVCDTIMRRP